jgi:hypothetical protein
LIVLTINSSVRLNLFSACDMGLRSDCDVLQEATLLTEKPSGWKLIFAYI